MMGHAFQINDCSQSPVLFSSTYLTMSPSPLSEPGLLQSRDKVRMRSCPRHDLDDHNLQTIFCLLGYITPTRSQFLSQESLGNINALLPSSGQNVFCVVCFFHLLSFGFSKKDLREVKSIISAIPLPKWQPTQIGL